MNKPQDQIEAITQVEELIRKLRTELSDEPTGPNFGTHFWRRGVGGLTLDRNEVRLYRNGIAALVRAFGSDALSTKAIRSRLTDMLLRLVVQTSDDAFAESLQDELADFETFLRAGPTDYSCLVRLRGFDTDSLPCRLGPYTFDSAKASLVALLGEDSEGVGAEQPLAFLEPALVSQEEARDEAFVALRVRARDSDGANTLALRRAERLVDTLNFFSDLVPYSPGYVYLPGRAASGRSIVFQVDSSGEARSQFERTGPRGKFSLKHVADTADLGVALAKVGDLLEDNPSSKSFSAAVLTAIEWAGRATSSRRRQESFLLFAIALEAILLPDTPRVELTYRLSLRLANTLGTESVEQRRDLVKRTKELYGIRSKIVHNGSYKVATHDLADIRLLAKSTILLVLDDEELMSMSCVQAGGWFENRIIS